MKNRLQIRYHIPETLPTRAQAMLYLKEAFAVGAANVNDNKSLPGEPLVILYNDKTAELSPAQSLATANAILAIGRGGDGLSRYNNQDYFVIDFAKHDEEILKLTEDVDSILEYVEEVKKTIAQMQSDIAKNAQDIQAILKKIGEKGDSPEKDTVYGYIEGAYNAIKDEVNRAEDAEQDLTHALQDEVTRAQAEESRLQTALDSEVSRAKDAELNIHNSLEAERDRALAAEEKNRDAIENEVARATTNETRIEEALTNEVARAKESENVIATNLANEIARSTEKDGVLEATDIVISKRLDEEVSRATAKENDLQAQVSAEVENRTNADTVLEGKIAENTNAINIEKLERQNADESLTTKINTDIESERKARENADYALNTKIDTEVNAERTARENADTLLETNLNAGLETERKARENADVLLENKINANLATISSNKVKSEGKTILVTGPTENGTNLEVNVDNKTIVINETGTLSVASDALVQYKGENALHVSEVLGGAKTISLALNPEDKVLTNDENGLLATLSLKWVKATVEGEKDEIQLIGKNDTVISRIDVADFIKDGMLDTIAFDTTDAENPKLVFTFNTNSGKETISINVKELIDVYVAGNGIDVNNNVISLKLDTTGEAFLSVSENGLKLNGVQTAINLAKDEVTTFVNTEINKVNTNIEVLDGKVLAETNARLEADAKLREDFTLADANITKNYQDAIALVETALTAEDAAIRQEFKSADAEITTAYQNAIALLDTNYKAADAALAAEYKALNEKTVSDYKAADASIISEFQAADQALLEKINANTQSLNILTGDATVDGSVKDVIFDSALGLVVNTVTLEDANEQSLIKKFTIDGVPYFYTSNSTSDMKHKGSALNVVLDELRSDIDNNESATDELETTLNVLTSKVNDNTSNISLLRTDVDTNKNDIVVLKQDVAKVEESVDELEKEINNTVNSLLAPMQATIAALQSELATIKAELNTANTELATAKAEVATLKLEMSELKANAITDIQGTDNEIAVVKSGSTATIKFADDAYFVAGV